MEKIKGQLESYKEQPFSLVLRFLMWIATFLTVGITVCIVGYILIRGIPNLSPEMFAWEYNTENVSMMPAIINTVLMVLLVLLIAVPVGIGAAIYLVEYAKRGSKLVKLVRITAETLSGIPSIVYGLFGYLLFATTFRWGYTFLGGALTLAIMILPLILRTTEEALKAVPDSFREGSFGLGAGSLRTIFRIILPSAVPGIVSGVILGYRPCGRRDGSTDVYSRYYRKSTWTDEFGKNAGCSYVRIVVRGTVYETGICNGSGTPGSSTSDQCRFRLDREKTDKEVRKWRKINLR